MRKAVAMLCVLAGLVVAGCATDPDGCTTDTCRAQMAVIRAEKQQPRGAPQTPAAAPVSEEDRQRAAAEACARAEANPGAADPNQVRRCRAARWQSSGVVCTDLRVDDRLVEITCEAPFRNGQADAPTAAEMALQRAAVATLSAGLSYVIFAGETPPQVHYSSMENAPVTCKKEGFLPNWNCSSDAPQPRPLTATFRQRYEMLNETEASARTNPKIPPTRRPQSATRLIEAYAIAP